MNRVGPAPLLACLAGLTLAHPAVAEGWGGLFAFPAEEPEAVILPAPEAAGDAAYPEAVAIRGYSAGQSATPTRIVAPQPGNGVAGDPRYDTGFGAGREDGICLAEILAAQQRYAIPGNLLLAIGLQEAGFNRRSGLTVWPWSVNAAGEGRLFRSQAEALSWVRQRQAQGVTSIDIGCMQINQKWHPDAFPSLEAGFDPALNVDYAARFLRSLYDQTGDWMLAAGSYHSFNPEPRRVYLASLKRNLDVANARLAGFVEKARLSGGAASDAELRYASADALDLSGTVPRIRQFNPLPKRQAAGYRRNGGGTMIASDGTLSTDAEALPPTPPRPGAFWSSSLGGDDEDSAHRTLYSSIDLAPILPNFTPTF